MEVDIAIDLMASGRLPSFHSAQRPAPVQVNFLGFPRTSGAPHIDYIIADRFLIPEQDRRFFSEQVVYMPDTYQANDSKRAVAERTPTRPEAGLPEDAFVFCCFNNNYKILPDVFDIWMRLLRGVEGSVLWLLQDSETRPRPICARGCGARRRAGTAAVRVADHTLPSIWRGRSSQTSSSTPRPFGRTTTCKRCSMGGTAVVTFPRCHVFLRGLRAVCSCRRPARVGGQDLRANMSAWRSAWRGTSPRWRQ
jgi:hypothetical protein